ncbi:hypothetical protein FQN57_005943 [Myotisia sp. PD_48]|nr:hypothetical protein FQN57_005943 [Myotisia sp. PD_48]
MSYNRRPKSFSAYCEDFDEESNSVIPGTRKYYNAEARSSKPDLAPLSTVAPTDVSSDSGYSSRTAATVGSSSLASEAGGSSIASLDHKMSDKEMARMAARMEQAERERERNSRKGKDKATVQFEDMARTEAKKYAPEKPSNGSPSLQRTASKSRRRESGTFRHPHESCPDCDIYGYHHQSPAMAPGVMDSRGIDPSYFPNYYRYDIPPSSQAPHYPPVVRRDMPPPVSPAISHARSPRVSAYHPQSRPSSYHPAMADMNMLYMHGGQPSPYVGHGPPLSSSAYSNPYMNSPFMNNDPNYPHPSPAMSSYEAPPLLPQQFERRRSQSMSRQSSERPAGKRTSLYGLPVVQNTPPRQTYMPEKLERKPSRESRPRPESQAYDQDEAYYRMPPPPPRVQQQKPKPAPQVIPIGKRPSSKRTTNVPVASNSRADMTEVPEAPRPPRTGRSDSHDAPSPEHRPSAHSSSKTRVRTSYYDSARSARISVAGGGRSRRMSSYHAQVDPLEQKQRDIEEYQAAHAARQVPLTADMLKKARRVRKPKSETASEESSSSASSRESDLNTRTASGVGSRAADSDRVTVVIRGVRIALPADEAKTINLRPGEEGQVELNIEGPRPQRYFVESTASSSSYRKGMEEVPRTREGFRSERDIRRSSRSTFSGRGPNE